MNIINLISNIICNFSITCEKITSLLLGYFQNLYDFENDKIELLQIKNFKGDFKIAKILKYLRLKLINFKGEKVILQHV
ncbi:MAG: hypothetical protein BWK75_07060 [Candidatus Altiarchaeales archaeon A3]|nr:MAG: hypothetical protein BWK75_07060 [Candidatus Altiarchaeales archaeon A3]